MLQGGDGVGGVAADDDDVIIGDNATVDRFARHASDTGGAELDRLPFNGAWGETTWNEPNILRVIRLLDVLDDTGLRTPETNGTNGTDTINGEAKDDVLFGQGGDDTITGDDADLGAASAADANPGDDYIEGNGGADTIRGDPARTTSPAAARRPNGVLDANRDGTLDPTRSGETLSDAGDMINGDSRRRRVGVGDVIAGDNARIQRKLDAAGRRGVTDDAARHEAARRVPLRHPHRRQRRAGQRRSG